MQCADLCNVGTILKSALSKRNLKKKSPPNVSIFPQMFTRSQVKPATCHFQLHFTFLTLIAIYMYKIEIPV